MKTMYNENEMVHLSTKFGCDVSFALNLNNELLIKRQFMHLTDAFVCIFSGAILG